eukprot:m.58939 g.58939  ORF g.58939 m.58939 type:complete len:262 (+) comp11292_c0_seq1:208-993(+)
MNNASKAASKRARDRERKKRNRRVIFSILWIVLLCCACILHWYCYMFSDEWVVTKKHVSPEVHVGLLGHYHQHVVWFVCVILLGISLAFITLATFFVLLYGFYRFKKSKKIREFSIIYAKRCSVLTAIFMFVGVLIFPIGFESEEALPCEIESTKETMYHLCNPWTAGIALYLLMVAQVFLTLSVCFAGCVPNDVTILFVWLSLCFYFFVCLFSLFVCFRCCFFVVWWFIVFLFCLKRKVFPHFHLNEQKASFNYCIAIGS